MGQEKATAEDLQKCSQLYDHFKIFTFADGSITGDVAKMKAVVHVITFQERGPGSPFLFKLIEGAAQALQSVMPDAAASKAGNALQ
jgi:hypothetical protein